MKFVSGHQRILDRMKPKPRAVGLRFYFMARWRRINGKHRQYQWISRVGHKPKKGQRGWMPGRWRIDGMQAPRRVIRPAVRYEAINRACAEIIKRRNKQKAWPQPYLWAKRIPKRPQA